MAFGITVFCLSRLNAFSYLDLGWYGGEGEYFKLRSVTRPDWMSCTHFYTTTIILAGLKADKAYIGMH